MSMEPTRELPEYYRFTTKSRMDKAINQLEGIIQGMVADSRVDDSELDRLQLWIADNRDLSEREPFVGLLELVNHICADRIVDPEERADLLWFFESHNRGNPYFDKITSDLQQLLGLIDGITADGKINKDELEAVLAWIGEHKELSGCWPFDEFETIFTIVLKDGEISDKEHDDLLYFLKDFVSTQHHRTLINPVVTESAFTTAVCAMDPQIEFTGKVFCATGELKKAKRSELKGLIEGLGGVFKSTLSKDTNYLIVGADGNPCWAYSCYGRKIEKAVEMRKAGSQLLVVHEFDFWDNIG